MAPHGHRHCRRRRYRRRHLRHQHGRLSHPSPSYAKSPGLNETPPYANSQSPSSIRQHHLRGAPRRRRSRCRQNRIRQPQSWSRRPIPPSPKPRLQCSLPRRPIPPSPQPRFQSWPHHPRLRRSRRRQYRLYRCRSCLTTTLSSDYFAAAARAVAMSTWSSGEGIPVQPLPGWRNQCCGVVITR